MRRERGAALLLALGVVASVAVTVSDVLMQDRRTLSAAGHVAARAQVREIAVAGTAWAQALLDDDAAASRIDALTESWAVRLPPTPAEGGRVSGAITDQQARFDLNSVAAGGRADERAVARLRRLLTVLGLDPGLADAVVDWVDADDVPYGGEGAESAFYGAQVPARAVANHPLISPAELAQVRGFGPAVLARLLPFVTALPARAPVNVNTAPPEVLAALVEGLTPDAARALDARRRATPFLQPEAFLAALPPELGWRSESDIGVGSRYFSIEVTAERDDVTLTLRTLVEREPGLPARVLHRSVL